MSESDHYRTLREEARAEIRVQRSRFLGIAAPLADEGEFHPWLERIAKATFDATHHCWAWRLFEGGRARSSDAGEPSGTAGRPILQAIESAALHDLAVVVVRWYGGVKLGTGGLARAYRDAAALALGEAARVDRYLYQRVTVTAHHRDANAVFRLVAPPDVVLVSSDFGEDARFELDVRRSKAAALTEELRALRIEAR